MTAAAPAEWMSMPQGAIDHSFIDKDAVFKCNAVSTSSTSALSNFVGVQAIRLLREVRRLMGPSLLIATCLILAIRTAKWPANFGEQFSDAGMDREIDYAAHLAS
jgi:hypothetical protein